MLFRSGARATALLKSLRDGPNESVYGGPIPDKVKLLEMDESGWIRVEKALQFLQFSRLCHPDGRFRKGTPYTKGDLIEMIKWLNDSRRAVHDNIVLKVVPHSPDGARYTSYPHLKLGHGIITHIRAGHRTTRMNEDKCVPLRKYYDCINKEKRAQWSACENANNYGEFKHEYSRCQLSIPSHLIHWTKSRFLPSILALGLVDNGNKLQAEKLDESEMGNEIDFRHAIDCTPPEEMNEEDKKKFFPNEVNYVEVYSDLSTAVPDSAIPGDKDCGIVIRTKYLLEQFPNNLFFAPNGAIVLSNGYCAADGRPFPRFMVRQIGRAHV